MRVFGHMSERDLKIDTLGPPPDGLAEKELANWQYQRYIKEYLRCVASIDDNVGRMLDYLDAEGIAEDTLVIYTSDQGFFLGDHGWYDKRFMYEESLRMPFLVRYPREIQPGSSIRRNDPEYRLRRNVARLCRAPHPRGHAGNEYAVGSQWQHTGRLASVNVLPLLDAPHAPLCPGALWDPDASL